MKKMVWLTACLEAEGRLFAWSSAGASWQGVCTQPSVARSASVSSSAQRASALMCNKHKMHDVPLTGGQFRVLLPSTSYFLFLNKPTWARSAGGGRTFMAQWLLL